MKRNMQGDVASVQWLGKQLTRDFNLLPRSLLLPLSSSSCCSSSRIRSNVKQENYRRASLSTKQHVKQGKAYTNYDEICKMYLNLKTILLNNYDDRGFVINSKKENVKRTLFFSIIACSHARHLLCCYFPCVLLGYFHIESVLTEDFL